MATKLAKFIRQLERKRRRRVEAIIVAITQNHLAGLDIKPMSGHKGWFRCRVGDIRIIFVRTAPGRNAILDLNYRGQPYKRKR